MTTKVENTYQIQAQIEPSGEVCMRMSPARAVGMLITAAWESADAPAQVMYLGCLEQILEAFRKGVSRNPVEDLLSELQGSASYVSIAREIVEEIDEGRHGNRMDAGPLAMKALRIGANATGFAALCPDLSFPGTANAVQAAAWLLRRRLGQIAGGVRAPRGRKAEPGAYAAEVLAHLAREMADVQKWAIRIADALRQAGDIPGSNEAYGLDAAAQGWLGFVRKIRH